MIKFHVRGSGRLVILIHGLGSSRLVWSDLVEGLSRYFKLVTFDLYGHRESREAVPESPLNSMVEEIVDYLRNSHINRPHLMGHSLGGLIALKLVLRGDLSVGKAVIIDSPTKQRGKWLRYLIKLALKLDYDGSLRKLLRRYVLNDEVYEEVLKDALRTNRDAFISWLMDAVKVDLSREICSVRPPPPRC